MNHPSEKLKSVLLIRLMLVDGFITAFLIWFSSPREFLMSWLVLPILAFSNYWFSRRIAFSWMSALSFSIVACALEADLALREGQLRVVPFIVMTIVVYFTLLALSGAIKVCLRRGSS